jgi:hypothetical protein
MLEQVCDPDVEAVPMRALVSGVTPTRSAPNCGEIEKDERFQKRLTSANPGFSGQA